MVQTCSNCRPASIWSEYMWIWSKNRIRFLQTPWMFWHPDLDTLLPSSQVLVTPHVITCNALVATCGKAQQWQRSLHFSSRNCIWTARAAIPRTPTPWLCSIFCASNMWMEFKNQPFQCHRSNDAVFFWIDLDVAKVKLRSTMVNNGQLWSPQKTPNRSFQHFSGEATSYNSTMSSFTRSFRRFRSLWWSILKLSKNFPPSYCYGKTNHHEKMQSMWSWIHSCSHFDSQNSCSHSDLTRQSTPNPHFSVEVMNHQFTLRVESFRNNYTGCCRSPSKVATVFGCFVRDALPASWTGSLQFQQSLDWVKFWGGDMGYLFRPETYGCVFSGWSLAYQHVCTVWSNEMFVGLLVMFDY